MVDKAISFIADVKQVAPDKPFFLYFATGAMHAPHHVPQEWADKYKGTFDEGWDAYREKAFARQKELGVVTADVELSRHDPDVKPWDEAAKTIVVETNFGILGQPEEWLQAAEDVRVAYGFGKIPDPLVRSDIWEEKIYGVDREDRQVTRKNEDGDEWDVTDNFIGKYTMTIEARLMLVPMDKAPFWYFMEYGNSNFGGDGNPYPEIPPSSPTRFEGKTRMYIQRIFDYTFDLYKSKADLYLSKLVADEFSRAIGEMESNGSKIT